jgi:glycosyltransferase involved in cell wall biosynthesis
MAMRRVLMVAFHFPPCSSSSGIQRTLSFTKHLPEYGWQPVVLTAGARAYESTNSSQLASIPESVLVTRAPTLDAARHFSVLGRYPSALARPDRWATWRFSAIPAGLHLIRKHAIDAIWSTYPLATAHMIGASLARWSGLPWIADFRDPMVEHVTRTNETFPKDPALRNARLRIEASVARQAARMVSCTNGAREILAGRYPQVSSQRLSVITNGYDELFFKDAEKLLQNRGSSGEVGGKRVLLHSGVIYFGTDRDPEPLFRALSSLVRQGAINSGDFELRLRNPSNEKRIRELSLRHGIDDLVTVLPAIPYVEALAEMMSVGGLLVLQGFTSNPAVPAKLYEYLRAGRPIVGLVDGEGETAATLRNAGIVSTADIADPVAIEGALRQWLSSTGIPYAAKSGSVEQFSRATLTQRLAGLLDEVSSPRQK